MTNEALWLIDLCKKNSCSHILIKSFYKTLNGRVWDDDDLKNAAYPTSHCIIGLYYNSPNDVLFLRTFNKSQSLVKQHPNKLESYLSILEFDFNFKHAGELKIPIEKLKENVFDDFCKSIFTQLMMLVSKGYDIIYGPTSMVLIDAHTEMEILIQCDLIVES